MNEKSPALQDEDEAQDATVRESNEGAPRDELADLRRQNEELLTKLKYLQAEFENYRKRVPDAEIKDGMVKAVVRKGYRLHDRVLRPAQVIVVKNGGATDG